MNLHDVVILQLCIFFALYYILVLLMHLSGVVTIDEWRASIAEMDASISKTLKRFVNYLRAHKEYFSPICKFLKWLLRMIIKCICILPDIIMRFVRWAIRMYNGDDLQEMMPNPPLALTDRDILELAQRLAGNPFDSPTFVGFMQDIGVNHYEFAALDLKGSYKELTGEKLVTKVLYVIRNYIMETRQIQADIFIEMATPTRLVFAIPVSEYGRKRMLQKQQAKVPVRAGDSLPILKEEINVPDQEDEKP